MFWIFSISNGWMKLWEIKWPENADASWICYLGEYVLNWHEIQE